eukprot:TRINITY_DN111405_c0_g1_i1.p1 TRINITY_DN111405_c0_g1~~TRINITY_DN111405_c0_g1_i1.p1  ORF type:complete len:361 (-),score=83.09 TRINITY_DN111405_c0_g1_i1:274-1356(-)
MALTAFGLRLFGQLCKSHAGSNVVISPLSVKICLSMVAHGATKGSATEKEMLAILEDFAPVQVDSAMEVANSAWVRGEIKQDYITQIQKEFGAEASMLAGTSPEPINQWVKERTKGRIESLFDEELDPLTVMVLVNTVFFKGAWAATFDANDTKPDIFKAFDGIQIPCNMMYKDDKHMMFTTTPDAQVVRLPYTSGGLSATVLLPTVEGPEALAKVIDSLTPAWYEVHAGMRPSHVQLRLPRFKVDFGESLSNTLQELGMPTPFAGEASGAFLGMSDDPTVHLSEVMHKATIEVNEKGTVASAATGAVMKMRCLPPPATPVTVDRPFVFLITDDAGAIMFAANVVSMEDPGPETCAKTDA